jgi:hypothetical protein
MPKTSERQELILQLETVLRQLAIEGEDDTEEFEELAELEAMVGGFRYLNLREYLDKNKSLCECLWEWGPRDFKQAVRTSEPSFRRLLDLIKDHDVFKNNSEHAQTPVWIQLMVTLQICGLDGCGASNGRLARTAGFGHGTVCLFRDRVYKVLMDLKKKYVYWPNAMERKV